MPEDKLKIISSDDHIQEPPDTWTSRLPQNLRDRAPRLEKTPEGDVWVVENRRARLIGLQFAAGKPFEEYQMTARVFSEIRPGAYDPAERLKDMDHDGVYAHTLYSNCHPFLFSISDFELRWACFRAYNDFVSEICKQGHGRIIGLGMVPLDSVEDSVKELQRISKLEGIRGAIIPSYPLHGKPLNSIDYEPLWDAAEALGMPLHSHLKTGLATSSPVPADPKDLRGDAVVNMNTSSLASFETLSRIIFGGVLERHPRLQFVSAEGHIGWLAFFLARSDRNYERHRHWGGVEIPKPPSEYFHRQVYATFFDDRIGVRIRHDIGVDNIMWSSDYPHSDSTWPHSAEHIADHFKDVPMDEKRMILGGNAARLYGLSI
jgi:predicted TIM-barrel fold metal-dependent hydrolase